MRFLIDMNLPPELAVWLRTQGHDASHVIDAGYAASSDEAILTMAVAEQRIVISFDLDFGDVAGATQQSGASVILLRLRRANQAHVRQRLQIAIAQAQQALEDGAIVLVEDSRIRIRRMPPSRL